MKNSIDQAEKNLGLKGEGVEFGMKVVSPDEVMLGSIGGAKRLVFRGGGGVQIELNGNEIGRICAGMLEAEYSRNKARPRIVKVLKEAYTGLGGEQAGTIRIVLTVPLAVAAVDLKPVIVEIKPEV